MAQATVYQKHSTMQSRLRRSIWCDACPMPKGQKKVLALAKLRLQALVNGGRNYNGPKVAKFLVG